MSRPRWSARASTCRLLIGGATTSRVHTAVKIQPELPPQPGDLRHRCEPRRRRRVGPDVAGGAAEGDCAACEEYARMAESHAARAGRRRPARRSPTLAPTGSSSIGRLIRRRSRASSARAASALRLGRACPLHRLDAVLPGLGAERRIPPHPQGRQIWRGCAPSLRRRASHAEAADRGEVAARRTPLSASGRRTASATISSFTPTSTQQGARHAAHAASADGAGWRQGQSGARRFRRAEGVRRRRLYRRLCRHRRHRRGGCGAALRPRQRRLLQDPGQGARRPAGRGLRRGAAREGRAASCGLTRRTRSSPTRS